MCWSHPVWQIWKHITSLEYNGCIRWYDVDWRLSMGSSVPICNPWSLPKNEWLWQDLPTEFLDYLLNLFHVPNWSLVSTAIWLVWSNTNNMPTKHLNICLHGEFSIFVSRYCLARCMEYTIQLQPVEFQIRWSSLI